MYLMVAPFVAVGLGASILSRRFRKKINNQENYSVTISSLILVDHLNDQEWQANTHESKEFEETSFTSQIKQVF